MQIGYPNSEYQIAKLLIQEQPKPTQQGHKQAFDLNQTCGFVLIMTSKAEMFSFESFHQSKNIVHDEHVHVNIE